MLDAALTHELGLLRDTVRRFLAAEVVPYRDAWRAEGSVPAALWRRAGAAGLLCMTMPEAYGGAGADFRHEAVLIEELARIGFGDFGAGVHSGIVAPYILHYGTEAQRARWLPAMADGTRVGALAMTEPGTGSDVRAIRTRAVREGDGWVLTGQKTFITNGQRAGLVVVAARTAERGLSLFVVQDGDPGFSRGRNLEKLGMHAQDTSELFFDGVRLPADRLLGEEGRGMHQMMAQLPQERLIIALGGVAGIEAALAATIAYVREREAFGQKLMEFQNTRFVLADAKAEAVIGRVFVDWCLGRLIAGELDAVTAAMAKLWTTERQSAICDACLQLFGGYGYMTEYPIARMWADARVQRIYGGTNEIMKELIARSL